MIPCQTLANALVSRVVSLFLLRLIRLQSVNAVTPGPASTGLLYSIVLVRHGVLPALLAFFIWRFIGAAFRF
jgi:hypothetical protein